MTTGRTWELWACLYDNGTFMHVGAKGWVELHYLPEPVVPVLVEEVIGDPRGDEVTHYGWEDARRPRVHPSMIQRRCSPKDGEPGRAWMLLDMCFAYGMKAAIERGDGQMVALRITQRGDAGDRGAK